MSDVLLQRVSGHLDDANLLDGYAVRYYRWSDVDLNGETDCILFRMAGTAGRSDSAAQAPHVSIQMLCNPDTVTDGDAAMLAILQHFRTSYSATGVANFFPIGPILGPSYLQNNRARFELTVSCLVEDH